MTNELDAAVRSAEERWLELWERGPRPDRSVEQVRIGDPAPDAELLDASGESRRLSEFWADGPALILFWRGWGCGCGQERARRLPSELPDYVAAGARVAMVGQGEPERAAAYAEKYGLDVPVLSDPDGNTYRSWGLTEGSVAQVLFDAPEEFWQHSREVGERFQAGRREEGRPLVDNPWLLPGEFVVDASGTIRLAYRYQYCEDFPNPLVLTSAIKLAA